MQRTIKHIIIAAGMLSCVAGCSKYTSDCDVIIRPRIIRVQSSPAEGEAAYMARVYTYYIGENEFENWRPESYADADAGIIRNQKTGTVRSYDFMGEQSDSDTYVHFTLSRSPVMLVAVDPINKFYAYRELEIPVPMPSLQITLRFVLWRTEVRFKDSEWIVVNGPLEEAEAGGGRSAVLFTGNNMETDANE